MKKTFFRCLNPANAFKFDTTDLFLSHTWRKDTQRRDNHGRVRLINEALKKQGYATWFDEEKMTGRVRERMAKGEEYNILFLSS